MQVSHWSSLIYIVFDRLPISVIIELVINSLYNSTLIQTVQFPVFQSSDLELPSRQAANDGWENGHTFGPQLDQTWQASFPAAAAAPLRTPY